MNKEITLDHGGVVALKEVLDFVERYNKYDKEPLVAAAVSVLQLFVDEPEFTIEEVEEAEGIHKLGIR